MTGRIKALGAISAFVLGLAACSNTGASEADSGGDESGPLQVGVIVPLSGPSGPSGQTVLDGIEAAAAVVNEQGGVDGRELEVTARDDESTPAVGVSAANQLVQEGVDVVMGGYNSPVTLAIQPVLHRAGIFNVTSIPQATEILGGGDPDAVRLNAGNKVGGYSAAKYLADEVQPQRIAALIQNDAYGNDGLAQMQDSLSELAPDAEITATQKFEYTATDFRVAVSDAAAEDPDAVFTLNAAAEAGMPALMKQVGRSSMESLPKFAGTGTLPPSVVEAVGAPAEGWRTAELYFPDQPPFDSVPTNQAFVEQYQQAHDGAMPAKYAALGAMSVFVWTQAVSDAGTTDKQQVAEAIKGNTFSDTVFGEVEFTEQGQMISKVFACEVEDGTLRVTGEIDIPREVWQQ